VAVSLARDPEPDSAAGGGASGPPPAGPSAAPALEWTVNPWRERPGAAAAALVLGLGMCVLVAGLRLPPLVTLALCVLAVSSLAPAMAPGRCRVDAAGVARRGPLGWQCRAWSEIRSARLEPHGLVVSPFTRRHWLDPYRALVLPMPRRRGESLPAELGRRLAHHGL